MEWVETTGRTVDEAKNRALDQLGVAEDDAEIVILEEPKPGLFGRMRGEARVRARVRPTTPRPKAERRDRRKKQERHQAETSGRGTSGPESAAGADRERDDDRGRDDEVDVEEMTDEHTVPSSPRAGAGSNAKRRRGTRGGRNRSGPRPTGDVAGGGASDSSDRDADDHDQHARRTGNDNEESDVDAAQVGEEAQRFVQGLVDAFGLTGTTSVRQDGDHLEVSVDGTDLGLLVGPKGTTLQAIQDLTRVAAQRRLGDQDTRLKVDVGGYRERRRAALKAFAIQIAERVIAEGTAKHLEPMSSVDRKIVHDTLAGMEGIVTRSEGEDPRRCVVIAPADA